jgi:peptidyl-prolyl cis-trans isomerase B (cyclophilin B)
MLLVGCAQAPPIEYEIQVQATDTSEPVSGAVVKAEMGLRVVVEAISDADGLAHLIIDEEFRNVWVKVTVEADEYQKQSLLVELTEENPARVVQLQPLVEEALAEEPVSEETAPVEEAEMASPSAHAAAEATQPEAATNGNDAAAQETLPHAGELANILPAERANYYQAKPELTIDTSRVYRATIQTNKGNIVVSLDATSAPEHVNNFIFLSNQGFYDGLTFHRVEPGFVVQGGDPEGTGQSGPGYSVPGEFNLTHGQGALAMARLPDQINPNRESSGSQFYITLAPTPFLDGQYSVFGQVEEGMDVVQAIEIGDAIERIIVEP